MSGDFLRMFSAFHKNQIRICQSLTILKEHEKAIGKLILIDDFIGSGETALGCMEYIKSLNINKDDIIIVSLVSQEEGIKLIRENDVLVYSALVRKKVLRIIIRKKNLRIN